MKYKYSVDSNNQLFIKSPRTKVPILASGRFSINKSNQLVYWLNEPASWRRLYGLPDRIIFEGHWQLKPDYDLALKLYRTKEQYEDNQLVIKGEIISVDKDTLAFEIKSLDKEGQSHIQIMKLAGLWQVNESNRISFLVKKKTLPDILTLEGAWQINENQQIIYTYEKTGLKTKTKIINTLTFEGFWQINSSNKLTYILSYSQASRFDFRAQVESPNIYPQKGVIKYRIGVGLRQDKTSQLQIISLYGTWKFSRKFGLIFQMDYGKDEIKQIEFGADILVNQKNKITFSLKDRRGESLGLNITFTHRFLNKLDAEAFLRLKETLKRDSAIEAGIRIPF